MVFWVVKSLFQARPPNSLLQKSFKGIIKRACTGVLTGLRFILEFMQGTSLTSLLFEKQKKFNNKFEKNFILSDELGSEPVIAGNDYQADDLIVPLVLGSEPVIAGKAALGNMLGGIGYFFGQSKISLPSTSTLNAGDNSVLYWPAELYTAVPSRPFFPRGFLWDEGFHQLLIWHWDIYISLDIIGHWLDLMNIDRWIPCELILGVEALSKVLEEFVLQNPTNGNPPTLFLALRDLISKMKKETFAATEAIDISVFLDRAFVRLKAWFKWFNTTQAGKEMCSYYWHGRDTATTCELNPKGPEPKSIIIILHVASLESFKLFGTGAQVDHHPPPRG